MTTLILLVLGCYALALLVGLALNVLNRTDDIGFDEDLEPNWDQKLWDTNPE